MSGDKHCPANWSNFKFMIKGLLMLLDNHAVFPKPMYSLIFLENFMYILPKLPSPLLFSFTATDLLSPFHLGNKSKQRKTSTSNAHLNCAPKIIILVFMPKQRLTPLVQEAPSFLIYSRTSL